MVTMTNIDNALKTLYLDVVAEQINTNTNPLLAKIKQSTRDVWGKEIRCLVREPVDNNYEQFALTLKNLYGTIELSDKAIRASENHSGAFVNLLNAEMEGLLKASAFNFGRMLYGDGSGVLCKVSSVSGNVVTVNNIKNVIEGLVIDFRDKTTGALISGCGARRIAAVDRVNKTITVSGAAISSTDVPANSLVTVQGSYDREITGLGAIFKTSGDIYGLSRTTHKWLVPYIKNNVGDITESVIQQAIDTLEEDAGSNVNLIVCSVGVRRAFMNHLATYKGNIDYIDFDGGYKAISYNGIPVISDRFCPEGTMYLLNTDNFTLHQLCDWRWLEDEEGKVLKQVAGTPIYSATLVKYADLICDKPCGQGMLTGITEA